MNNERGHRFPATPLTHGHTATVSYWTSLASLCSAAKFYFDNTGTVLFSKLEKNVSF